jgi:hypothetical protein
VDWLAEANVWKKRAVFHSRAEVPPWITSETIILLCAVTFNAINVSTIAKEAPVFSNFGNLQRTIY